MKVRELAHGRTGDKGDTLNVSVICFDARFYPHLVRQLTAERVKAHLQSIVRGQVRRYALPGIGALNFVLEHALGGGVTRSLALDAHGKSVSAALLDIEIDIDAAPPV